MALHENIKQLRKSNKLPIAFVADVTGLSKSYLYDIERGRTEPSLHALRKLAEVFGVSPGELLDGDQEGGAPETCNHSWVVDYQERCAQCSKCGVYSPEDL